MAAVVSPATSLIVLSFHKRFPYRQLEWHWVWPRLKTLKTAAKLGVSACLNELSTGVSIYVFNMVLLKLSGNYAVAAYGVISNIAIVTVAIANGVALGSAAGQSRIWDAVFSQRPAGFKTWYKDYSGNCSFGICRPGCVPSSDHYAVQS